MLSAYPDITVSFTQYGQIIRTYVKSLLQSMHESELNRHLNPCFSTAFLRHDAPHSLHTNVTMISRMVLPSLVQGRQKKTTSIKSIKDHRSFPTRVLVTSGIVRTLQRETSLKVEIDQKVLCIDPFLPRSIAPSCYSPRYPHSPM